MTRARKEWNDKYTELRATRSILDTLKAMSGLTFGGHTFTLDLSPEAIFVSATNTRGDVIEERISYNAGDLTIPILDVLAKAEDVMSRARRA